MVIIYMNIGIDGTTLAGQRAGVGRYVYELCRALDRVMPDANFFVYSHIPVEMPVNSRRWHARVEASSWAASLKNILWLKTRAPAMCLKDDLDVFWACGTFLPRLPRNVHSIVTVYDMNRWLATNTMKWTAYVAHRLFVERDIKRADAITSISSGTAVRLLDIVGRRTNAIVQPAVADNFRRPSVECIAESLRKFGIQQPYFLAVGTIEPRKNLALLVEVFTTLKRSGQLESYQLVLVGGKGWKDAGLRSLLSAHEDDGVHPIGFVNDSDLPSIYAGAEAFVFPSMYEGFGMPVLEARACDARVIASDTPEIREAGGDGPFYLLPMAEPLSDALLCFCNDKKLGVSYASSLPSWTDSAVKLAEVFYSRPQNLL
jgi:glycosyltransferase involved in cell wall biosynthesis